MPRTSVGPALPGPDDLAQMVYDGAEDQSMDQAQFAARAAEAVKNALQKQVAAVRGRESTPCARVVGPERVIASTECGFGTFVGMSAVAPRVAYAKLAALTEGAALASRELVEFAGVQQVS